MDKRHRNSNKLLLGCRIQAMKSFEIQKHVNFKYLVNIYKNKDGKTRPKCESKPDSGAHDEARNRHRP